MHCRFHAKEKKIKHTLRGHAVASLPWLEAPFERGFRWGVPPGYAMLEKPPEKGAERGERGETLHVFLRKYVHRVIAAERAVQNITGKVSPQRKDVLEAQNAPSDFRDISRGGFPSGFCGKKRRRGRKKLTCFVKRKESSKPKKNFRRFIAEKSGKIIEGGGGKR